MIELRIDCDNVVYMAGHAADSRSDQLSHSLHNAKLIIQKIEDQVTDYMFTALGQDPELKVKYYLTSSIPQKNFRFEVSADYKANRNKKCRQCKGHEFKEHGTLMVDGHYGRYFACDTCDTLLKDAKPVYYHEIRQYLIDRYNAIICEWGEADDWLAADATETTIIASNDKDLLMIPCIHYKISTEKFIVANDPGDLFLDKVKGVHKLTGYGFKWFCAQLLLGDSVDNIIKPVKGQGPKAIYEILNDQNEIETMFYMVEGIYRNEGKGDLFERNCKLLWMARKPKQMFSIDLIEELHNEIESSRRKAL